MPSSHGIARNQAGRGVSGNARLKRSNGSPTSTQSGFPPSRERQSGWRGNRRDIDVFSMPKPESKNKTRTLWILYLQVINFRCYCKSYCIPVRPAVRLRWLALRCSFPPHLSRHLSITTVHNRINPFGLRRALQYIAEVRSIKHRSGKQLSMPFSEDSN